MIYKKIILHRGKEESLRRFHPWVFSGAIVRKDEVEDGELVSVFTHDGTHVGNGLYEASSIAVRMLCFDDSEINQAFFEERLRKAFEMRKSLGLLCTDNSSFRLVHGEGDFLPGLVVDVYGATAVMQAHTPGMHHLRRMIADAIVSATAGMVKNVYYKSDTTLPFKAQIDSENGYLKGKFETDEAVENGLKFRVDWLRGQKTGFFVDQRENRSLVEQYAQGKKVLNMFCYTGGFSIYALRGGAELVHSVDSSAKAITLTEANVALNFGETARHRSWAEDAFKFLDGMEPDFYDLVILDPPAFAKHKSALKNALIGYRRLNAKAFVKIKSGGLLFTFSCSQAVNKDQFRTAVFSAAAMSGRKVKILHQLTQPADHPISIYHPEGEYLKGLVLWVE